MVLTITTNRYSQSMYNIRKALANHVSSNITCVKSHNMYHVVNTKIAFTKHVTIIENTCQCKIQYSPKYRKRVLTQIPKKSTLLNTEKEYLPINTRDAVADSGETPRAFVHDLRGERKLGNERDL